MSKIEICQIRSTNLCKENLSQHTINDRLLVSIPVAVLLKVKSG